MHGAIAADAFRIPWISVHSQFRDYLPFKWRDWCSSLNLEYYSKQMSTLYPPGGTWAGNPFKNLAREAMRPHRRSTVVRQLRKIAEREKPRLSDRSSFEFALEKVEEAVERFQRTYF